MISLSRFSLIRKGAELIVISLEDLPCSACGGDLFVHGTCKRKLRKISGETYTLRLRVMECKKCGHTHRELIKGIAPHRRYSIDLICAICEASDAGVAEPCIAGDTGDTSGRYIDSIIPDTPEACDTYICEESVRSRTISWVSWLIAYMRDLGICQGQNRPDQQNFSLNNLLKEGVREIVNSGRWKIQHHIVVQPF